MFLLLIFLNMLRNTSLNVTNVSSLYFCSFKKKGFCETLKSNKQSKNTAEGAEDMKGIARILLRSLFSYPS